MHRDLKPENFLYASKKESSPLKAIDFGLSVFFRPGMFYGQLMSNQLNFEHMAFFVPMENKKVECLYVISHCNVLHFPAT